LARLGAIATVLRGRNARVFYAGSLASWTGLWMQRVAVEWLAWQLTHSPLWVGILAFCNLAPSVVASPLAGAAADRLDRVRLTQVSQMVSAIHAGILVTLLLTGLMRVQVLAGLEVCLGIAQAFSQPARQTLIPGLVSRADLPAAVALNSLTFNLARFIGPAIAGPVIAVWGVVPAIAANCAAYLYASLSLGLMRIEPAARRGHAPEKSVWAEAAEGVAYVVRHPGLGPLFAYAGILGMFMRAVPEMLPPFVDHLFHRGASGLATLASTMGLAALVGGLLVAARGRLAGLSRIAVAGGLLLVVSTAGFVATADFTVGTICAGLMGAATTIHGIAVQTLLQNAAAGPMIGRVLSLWGMVIRAAPAAGALIFGAASEWLGLQAPVLIACACCAAAWAWARLRLPRMAPALEAAPRPAPGAKPGTVLPARLRGA
jgi:MFS family permease